MLITPTHDEYALAGLSRRSWMQVMFWCSIVLTLGGPDFATEDFTQLTAHASPSDLTIACAPDVPVTKQTAILRVWTAVSPAGEVADRELIVKWVVTGGRVDETTSPPVWDLSGEQSGQYRATVDVQTRQGNSKKCETIIYLQSEPTDNGHATRGDFPMILGRTFLLPGAQEKAGYGAYSYLLMGAPPAKNDSETKERYIGTIAAYLRLVIPLEGLERDVKPSQLNATYIPVREELPKEILEPTEPSDTRKLAEWVFDHYDYRKAQILLQRCGEAGRDGPYLYSFLSALGKGEPSRPILRQSLVNIPPEQAEQWVNAYVNQAAQIRLWEKQTFVHLRLQMVAIVSSLLTTRSAAGATTVLGIIVIK